MLLANAPKCFMNQKSPSLILLACLALCSLATPGTANDLSLQNGQSIAFLGDSITAQGVNPGGYVRLVISGLEANGIKVTPISAGVSGNQSEQMLGRLEQDVLRKKPTWMTLSCGVNDVWHGAKGVPLDQYKKNITEMIDRCQSAGISVLIMTATMIQEDQSNALNQQLVAYNDFLRNLAREKHCRLADLNAEMQEALKEPSAKPTGRFLTIDGVHMNPAGNEIMAIGVLKGFGLDGPQIQKAEKQWLDAPDGCEVPIKLRMTLQEFQQFNAKASQLNRPVADLLESEIKELLKTTLKQQQQK